MAVMGYQFEQCSGEQVQNRRKHLFLAETFQRYVTGDVSQTLEVTDLIFKIVEQELLFLASEKISQIKLAKRTKNTFRLFQTL